LFTTHLTKFVNHQNNGTCMIVEIKVPTPGESITEVEIANWLKADGDFVNDGDELFEVESDKATLSVPAEGNGILKILVEEGETVAIGVVACTVDTSASGGEAKPAPAESTSAPVESAPVAEGGYPQGHPSVAAQKIMSESGVDSSNVQGTGKGGRITKTDALGASSKATPPTPVAQAKKAVPVAAPSFGGSRNTRREKMSNLRKKIAERLVAVKSETAMLTTFNEVDLTEIMAIRSKYKEQFKETHEIGLGFMSFFTKACVEALKTFPAVNASIDGKDILFHDYVDVGIAVSAPRGLMVPVVRNAETLSLANIEKEIKRLAIKARDSKITVEDMTGGTFTITNGGVFGSLMSTPILNPPQSAILGMHKIQERPIAIDGKVEIRPMMYLALSYDHRVIDGKESVSFLVKVKEMLEDPIRFLLEL
jgi:2-oxoglutarate dehydrogenase E2 component (dihydrolipoamide succinyltransferase)